MDPSSKKWLEVCVVNFENALPKNKSCLMSLFFQHVSEEAFMHYYIHNSGLFYGHVNTVFIGEYESVKTWSFSDKQKVAILEGFLLLYLYRNKDTFKSAESYSTLIADALSSLEQFYVLFSISNSVIFKKYPKRTSSETQKQWLERLINYRVASVSIFDKQYWKGSNFSLFSFFDLLYYSYWSHKQYVYENHLAIIQSIIQTMISVCFSQGEFDKSNKVFLSHFISAAYVTSEINEEFQAELEVGVNIQNINYFERLPYYIRVIIYEFGVLAAFHDKHFSELEVGILKDLAKKLDILQEDAQYGIMLVESFLIQNYNTIIFLNSASSIEHLSRSFSGRLQNFIGKNKVKVWAEVSDSKELMELLWKAKNEKLTPEELEKVKLQIVDLMKTLPSLAIFMLPGGSLLLPILLKVLPEDLVLPSSFVNKVEEKKKE